MARRYLVVRTDKNVKPFVLRELEAGRLRQGWGYQPDFDLRVLQKRLAKGEDLDDEEKAAWRNRRLLDTEADGLQPGDIVIIPNLPEQGEWVLARVAGPYTYSISTEANGSGTQDYGHIVAVSAIRDARGKIAVVEADNENVDARLRASMRNLSRMWSIDALGGAVEKLVSAIEGGKDTRSVQPEAEKAESFFEGMRGAAWGLMQQRYKGAEFEQLVQRLFTRIYRDEKNEDGRVEHWGGAGEKGADLIVFTSDPLGIDYKIAVQVKMHEGVHDDTHALEQIRQAHECHRVHAGVVVTTASETSARFNTRKDALEVELAIDIKVITRDEVVELVMKHLGSRSEV